MTSAFCPFASALRRGFSRLGGTMAAFLFSLALAGCGGSGGGSGFLGDSGGNVGDGAGPGTSVVSGAEGISEERRRAMAARVAGLDLGGEDKVRTEDVQVSENPEILNQNPFATAETAPETVAEARGFERQSVEEERKTPGYKAFEVAVPADNPLMTVAVWISETAPEEEVELPESKPERDPEAPRKFLYVRLQVYVSTRNFAAVEGGGVEVLETQVIAVEERLPDPKPPAGADECEAAGWKAARVDGNAINCLIPLTSGGTDFEGCVLAGEFEPLCSEVFGAGFAFPPKLEGEEARYVFNCGAGMVPESANMMGATQCFSLASNQCEAGTLPRFNFPQEELNLALRTEARRGNAPLVCEALRRGADIDDDLQGTEFTALQEAVSGGHLEVAELLLANGAEVNARKEGAGPSALDLAARAKNAEIAAVLRAAEGRCFLESGGLCEETVAEGTCPAGTLSADGLTEAQLDARMISAAEDGDADAVCEYLRRGANIEAQKTGNLRTALMIAALDGHADVAELLINNGADVNYRGGNGGYGGRPNPGRWRDYPDSNWPALLYAAGWNGNVAVARLLLDNSANIELGDDRNRRPLWEAAFNGHLDMMELLLDRGADVNGADVWGITPLHAPGPHYGYPGDPEWPYAAEVAEYLISRGANVNALDTWGRSPLDLYAGWNHPNAAAVVREAGGRCFVESGALCEVAVASDTVCTAGSLSADGKTQAQLDAGLISAARDNDLAEVCEYLRRGANVDAQESEWRYYKRTPLMIAAMDGNLELGKLLRRNGADVNLQVGNYNNSVDAHHYQGNRRMPALHYAAGAGRKEFVEWLLSEGANVRALQALPRDALWEAAFWGRPEIVRILLTAGADANKLATGENLALWDAVHHPTHWAKYGNPRWGVSDAYARPTDEEWVTVISILVANGADVNVREPQGASPLDIAVRRGNAYYAELMREYGSRCFVETGPLCEVAVATPVTSDTVCAAGSLSANGMTQAQLDAGLIAAVRGDNLEDACEYLRRGANPGARETSVPSTEHHRKTGLIIAAFHEQAEMAKLLLNNGADVNQVISGRSTQTGGYRGGIRALSYAFSDPEIVKLLLDRGADVNAQEENGRTALWEAAHWGFWESVKVLLDGGANPNLLDYLGASALYGGVVGKRNVRAGPSGYVRFTGWRGYDFSSLQSWPKVVSLLLAAGADVNAREGTGNSDVLGYRGYSSLDFAARMRYSDIAEILRDAGGRCFVRTGPLCEVAVATPEPVVSTVVTSDTVCTAGSLSANGMTQAQLDAGLMAATKEGDLATACEYLRRGADPNGRDAHQHVPLMHAKADLDMGGLLLANGAKMSVWLDGGWWTPLFPLYGIYTAAQIEFYLSRGADVNLGWFNSTWTPLHEAAFYGKWLSMQLLLDGGVDPNVRAVRPGWRGRTALHEAVGDSSDSFHFAIDASNPPFGMIVGNSARAVSVLLEGGAEVNARDGRGYSPLDRAALHSKTAAAAVLRAAGGRCFVRTGPLCEEAPAPVAVVSTVVASDTVCAAGSLSANGMTQAQLDAELVSAVRGDNLENACEYLRRGANPGARETSAPSTEHYRKTGLMIAAVYGQLEMAKLLLNNGAEANQKAPVSNSRGWIMALPSAIRYPEIIKLLLDRGADINLTEKDGRGALWGAAHWGFWESVKLLLERGADPNLVDTWGASALYGGVVGIRNIRDMRYIQHTGWRGDDLTPLQSWPKVVSLLLAAGADVNAREETGNSGYLGYPGYSSLDFAARRGYSEVAGILRDAGGRCFVRTGPLCGEAVATPEPVVGTVVASDTVCTAGSLPGNGMTQAQLDAGLIAAAGEGDLTTACEYLRRGANPNGRDAHQHVPLMHAKAHLDMGELLLANGADKYVLIDGNGWWSPLFPLYGIYTAAQIEFYLSRGVDPNFGSLGGGDYDWRPLHEAAFYGKWNAIKHLLDGGAVPNVHTSRPGWRGRTALHEAVGDSSDSFHFAIDASNPPFGMIVGNSARAVSVLLEGGAEVNARDGRGYSPLDRAALHSKTAAAAVLRAAGGRCFVRTGPLCEEAPAPVAVVSTVVASDTVCAAGSLSANGLTQRQLDAGLVSAAKGDNLPRACEYLRRGASADARERSGYLRTALIIAADKNFTEMAELLLTNGADPDEGGARSWGAWGVLDWAPLHYAASRGHTEIVRILLANDADANIAEGRNRRPLYEAAFHGRLDIAEMLLAAGAELDARDQWGLTAVQGGVSMGSYGEYSSGASPQALVVTMLLSRGAGVNVRHFETGESPLDFAVRHYRLARPMGGDAERYAAILRNAGGKCFVETGPLCGETMVGVEYSSSANGTVSAGVESGGEVARGTTVAFTATPAEGYYVSGWTGNCASAGAVSDGLDGAAKVCSVSADADLNVGAVFAEVPSLAGTDCPAGTLPANGLTQTELDTGLLSAAAANNVSEICEYLRRGADVNAVYSSGWTALHRAAWDNSYEAAELLIANGADVHAKDSAEGEAPLHKAAWRNSREVAELLLANGADANATEHDGNAPDGNAPLHFAARFGGVETMRLLIANGANVNATLSNERSPLIYAVFDKSVEKAELLLANGADVNGNAVSSGWTPLYFSTSSAVASSAVVALLLAHGAEVNTRVSYGKGAAPLDRAARHNQAEIAALLRDAGGKCFLPPKPLCGETVAVEYSSATNGTVSADVASGGEVARGTTVAFTATPDEGWYVSEWTGNCADTTAGSAADRGAKVCSLTADAALSVGVVFAEILSLAGPECPGGTMPGNGLTQAELNAQLRLAARNGNTRKICEMLRRGAEVNDNLDGNEFTALQEAVSEEHKAAAEMLLANNAQVNARKGGTGPAPLDLAAQNEDAEIAQILRDADGQCFVETGPLCGDYVPAATLDPSTVAVTTATTATVAIEDLSCPTEPLSAEGRSQSSLNRSLRWVARIARSARDYETVCRLIRQGADVKYADDTGSTPLHRVFVKAFWESGWTDVKLAVAELLIERGADVNAADADKDIPLHVLVSKHCDRRVRAAFCERGVELLIENGADVNAKNDDGISPLAELAWRSGKWEILHGGEEIQSSVNRVAMALIHAGADVNAKDSRGFTPLHEAFSNWFEGVNLRFIQTLIDNGADVNAKDDTGWTPLHEAVLAGIFEGVKILVDNGADVHAEDDNGDVPLQQAREDLKKGFDVGDIVAFLEAAMATPVAVVPESDAVPESVTEELQEEFQAAFNPAPAFGDAFGAAASPGRFLTRLDSLMRATSGTGDVWDSFYGWQKENDFGRVWFSTGQRGDFGFGAGSLGGGESGFGKVLDANPFAGLSGNGMLAGGETGFGESGKLRVAAFGDYESQSLLSGEDGKWTRWAASGTAIETAMSEAERFSGLSENKTRGAMTEFHLGGADVGVALQAGAVSESESALGGTARNESLRGLRSRTAFAGLSGSAALLGTGWRLRGAAHVGRSWAESDGMLRSSDLWASAFSAGLERGGWLYSDDGFVLRFSQPLRVEIWERELANDNGVRRMGISPSGRQLDVDAAYRLPLSGGGWLLFSAGVRRDGGHSSGSGVEGGALFAVEKGF